MNHFQLVSVVCLLVCCVVTIQKRVSARITRGVAVGWLGVWGVSACAIMWPHMTAYCARLLGIGRGADLVFYCAIMGMFFGFFYMYIKMRRIEDMITKITRHLALEEDV